MAFKKMNAKLASAKIDPPSAEKINEMIKQKAFDICQKRGCTPGRELDDWLQAEQLVKREMSIR